MNSKNITSVFLILNLLIGFIHSSTYAYKNVNDEEENNNSVADEICSFSKLHKLSVNIINLYV